MPIRASSPSPFRTLSNLLVLVTLLFLAACGKKFSDTGDRNTGASQQPGSSPLPATSTPAGAATGVTPAGTDPAPTALLSTPALETPAPPDTGGEPDQGPDCTPPAALTPSMTEGPYYKPGSPERTSLLEQDTPGTRLILTGYVLTMDCQPVANAWVDFWQTDGNGEYDNAGFKMRGQQHTDDTGRFYLETVVPGLYPGRTAHIHVKVQAPGGPVLTTQLFVPDEPGNQSDRIFSPELVMKMQDAEGGKLATFNFVVETR